MLLQVHAKQVSHPEWETCFAFYEKTMKKEPFEAEKYPVGRSAALAEGKKT